MISLMVLSFLTILGVRGIEDRIVDVDEGVITVNPRYKCDLEINGMGLANVTGVVPGYHFGLITYKCGIDFGYVVSKLECKDCGMYCTYNDMVDGCQNYWLQSVLGIAIGIVIGMVTSICIYCFVWKYVGQAYRIAMAHVQHRSDRKANRSARLVGQLTGLNTNPIYKNKVALKDKYHKIAYKKRNMPNDLAIEMSDKPSITEQAYDEDDCVEIDVTERYINHGSSCPTTTPNDIKCKQSANNARGSGGGLLYPILTTIGLLGSLTPTSNACDMNFYFNNNGKICDTIKCVDINMYNFPISYGQEICFQSSAGDVTKFKIEKAYLRHRYNKMYYTSDYTVGIEKYWDCEGTGQCDKSSCRLGTKYSGFVDKGKINYYTCETEASPCATYCYWGSHCMYYHYWIIPKGVLYPVYFEISNIWEVVVAIEKNGLVLKKTMNVNNPTINMNFENIENNIKMPMHVISTNYENKIYPQRAVLIDNELVFTDVSDLNMPKAGTIGEYQISTLNNTQTYDHNLVKCQTNNCDVKCINNEQTITKLRSTKIQHLKMDDILVSNNGFILESITQIHPTLNLAVGNVEFTNLYVVPSKCKIEVISTFGCLSCNTKPIIVFNSYDIVQEGVLEYESICKFNRNYLSCSQEPYVLELDENYKECNIRVNRLNMTINFTVDYRYMGALTPQRAQVTSESTIEIAKSIMSSEAFLNGVFRTLATCAILSTVLTVTLRLIRLYSMSRVVSTVNKE